MKDCLFCKIINGVIPSYKIYEDEKTFAFLDIAQDSYGHILVIPKNHCENILDCKEEDMEAVSKTLQKISQHLVKNCGFDGINIVNNNGACANQKVMHLHFHILPKIEGGKLDPTISLKEVCAKLKM